MNFAGLTSPYAMTPSAPLGLLGPEYSQTVKQAHFAQIASVSIKNKIEDKQITTIPGNIVTPLLAV